MSKKERVLTVFAVTNPIVWFVGVPVVFGIWLASLLDGSVKRTARVVKGIMED